MIEPLVRDVAAAYPGVNVRALVHVIEGAVAEAASGLTAVRVIAGWRIVTDRTPPGVWRTVATPIAPGPYPLHPPDAVIVAVLCIVTEAGADQDRLVDATKYVPSTGEFRVDWTEEVTA